MKGIIHFLDKYFEETIIGVCMGYFAIATFMQVFFRFVLQAPLAWTDETARYAFIWMVFVGSAVAVKKRTHIRVDLLEIIVKNDSFKATLQFINWCLFLLFAAIATWIGVEVCAGLLRWPYGSPALEIPMFWVFLSLPVGMGLTTLRILQAMYTIYILKRPDTVANKEEVVE